MLKKEYESSSNRYRLCRISIGVCFAEMGNRVTCVDIDETKINRLKKGIIPIYESGLEAKVLKNLDRGNLRFTTKLEGVIANTKIVFIAVGTPMREDDSAGLQYVLSVAKEIGQKMQNRLVVVDKSTVTVDTADKVKATIQVQLDKRDVQIIFDVVSNP